MAEAVGDCNDCDRHIDEIRGGDNLRRWRQEMVATGDGSNLSGRSDGNGDGEDGLQLYRLRQAGA